MMPYISIHHFMNEVIDSCERLPFLTYQREEPTTGVSISCLISHVCRTGQILEQNMFSSCASIQSFPTFLRGFFLGPRVRVV